MTGKRASWVTLTTLVGALALAAQLGGLVHMASDLFVEAAQDHCGGCDDESSGVPCPPLCSDCTGAHGTRPALIAVADRLIPFRAASAVVPAVFGHPEDPPLDDIFHPPQHS